MFHIIPPSRYGPGLIQSLCNIFYTVQLLLYQNEVKFSNRDTVHVTLKLLVELRHVGKRLANLECLTGLSSNSGSAALLTG